MPSGILGIGVLGLSAAQFGIRTTQYNISNVNSPGYHRQGTNLATSLPILTGAGFLGNGVNVTGVSRAYDTFLENELSLSQAQLSRHQAYANYATRMDAVFGGESSGLGVVFNEFFSAVNEVANAPTSLVARQSLLSAGSNLARRFDDLDTLTRNMQDSLNQQMRDITGQVTIYARQIAEINVRINTLQSGNGDFTSNDLLDQRDRLAAEVNKLVGANVVVQSDGSYNLYIGSGQALVSGGRANSMAVIADPSDSAQRVPTLRVGSSDVVLGSNQVRAGMLGGLLAFRDDMLVPTQRQLGTIAYAMASGFNAQHALGFDLNGVAGGDFFSPPTVRQPVAHQNNAGNAVYTVSIDDINLLPDSDFRLGYDGTDYTLTRLSDGTAFTGGSLAALNTAIAGEGISFTLTSGTIQAGDSYLVRPTQVAAHGLSVAINDPAEIAAAGDDPAQLGLQSLGPGDNSNALLLAGLQGQKLLANTSNTLQVAYNQIVGRNAALASSADINVQAYETLTQQAEAAQQAFSGVNLDEEAVNLIQYQQAYQAAARAIQIASSLFEEILAIAR